MDLTVLANFLVRRTWLAILLGALGALAGLALAVWQAPVYEATTRLAVEPARPADLGQTQAIRNIMQSFAEDIKTSDTAADAARRLGADWLKVHGLDAGAIPGMLYTDTDANVYEIRIQARAGDPNVAAQVSTQVAIAFQTAREKANLQLDRDDRIHVTVRETPVPTLYSPRKRVFIPVGAVLGLMIGVALMFLTEYLESAVVRSAAEAERVAGAVVVGTVPAGIGSSGQGTRLSERGTGSSSADMGPRTGSTGVGGVGGIRGVGGAGRNFGLAGSGVRHGLADAGHAAGRLARAAWPVVLMAVLGGVSAFAFSKSRPTVWIAHTRIALEAALGSDWGRTQAIPEVMRSYSEQMRTTTYAEAVNNQLQLDRPIADLLDPRKLNIASKDDLYEIVVDFRDPDRDQAEAISRAWAQTFVQQRTADNLALDQRDRILARLRSATASEVWAPKPLVNALAGAVLGALIGAVGVFCLALLRGRFILNAADAQNAAGRPTLGAIPAIGRGAQ